MSEVPLYQCVGGDLHTPICGTHPYLCQARHCGKEVRLSLLNASIQEKHAIAVRTRDGRRHFHLHGFFYMYLVGSCGVALTISQPRSRHIPHV